MQQFGVSPKLKIKHSMTKPSYSWLNIKSVNSGYQGDVNIPNCPWNIFTMAKNKNICEQMKIKLCLSNNFFSNKRNEKIYDCSHIDKPKGNVIRKTSQA